MPLVAPVPGGDCSCCGSSPEIAVWIVTLQLLLHLDANNTAHGPDYGWLTLILLARDGLLIAIAALVIRDMWAKPPIDVSVADFGEQVPAR